MHPLVEQVTGYPCAGVVHQDVLLAPLHPFAGVAAADPARLGGLDTRAIYKADGRLRILALLLRVPAHG